MWIWFFRRVDSVVFVLCAKFGLNTCYGHRDPRTYASDIHLKTSRELTSGFDFWSRGHLRMAVMHLPIKFGAYIFIQSKVIDIIPKFKMATSAILDFQVMWIWPFRHVDSVVFVLCPNFGPNICYCHWDQRTYPSDLHLMTLRELTSGFDLWSCGHGRDAYTYLYPIRSYWHFPEIKDGGRRHLRFVGETMGPPTKAYSWCVLPLKVSSWWLSSLQVIRFEIFVVQAWKSYSRSKNFSFGGFYLQNLGGHRSDFQKAHPCVISRLLTCRA